MKKERLCKQFYYDSDVNSFLAEHPDWEIICMTGSSGKYNSLWILFERYIDKDIKD